MISSATAIDRALALKIVHRNSSTFSRKKFSRSPAYTPACACNQCNLAFHILLPSLCLKHRWTMKISVKQCRINIWRWKIAVYFLCTVPTMTTVFQKI
jgi:hypothetical protein